jgi:hypothetical protein
MLKTEFQEIDMNQNIVTEPTEYHLNKVLSP